MRIGLDRWRSSVPILLLLLLVGASFAAAVDRAQMGASNRDREAASQSISLPDENRRPPEHPSAARLWDEQLLAAIRLDIPKPPVHARNLYHLSLVMWDAWAAYSPAAIGKLTQEKHTAADAEAARAEAISYAAYRLLQYRFPVGYVDRDNKPCHPNAAISQAAFDAQMDALGYDKSLSSTIGDTPAALGNRIAEAMIAFGQTDGSNEGLGRCYPDDTNYIPYNDDLIIKLPGAGRVFDPNRWQPLAFDFLVTQNGIPLGISVQRFIGVGWADVAPFALSADDVSESGLYLDPGPQPHLGGPGDETLKAAMVQNILYSSQVDPTQSDWIDISPSAIGNNSLGADDGAGREVNPVTRRPYPPDLVLRADFQRVVSEFWADGPRSETPPGHWNTIANVVSDHPLMKHSKRIGGKGKLVNDLEWDVKLYLALNGALHDAAIWCWGTKNHYDSSRPITLIRYMGGAGQSSDPAGGSYHQQGLPLVPNLIEVITEQTTQPGERHAGLAGYEGEIAIRAWRGSPPDPHASIGGVGWIRAVSWMPYQASTFVTPPFPGYPSGHSSFSRSAAEVLAAFTGSPYFPGGLGWFVAPQNHYLSLERGPSQTVVLQWASYFDASDQAGKSRRFGGIHPFYDDYPSRITGSRIGKKAWARAQEYYGPSKVMVCHLPSTVSAGPHTIAIDPSAVPVHLSHGDHLGSCPEDLPGDSHTVPRIREP